MKQDKMCKVVMYICKFCGYRTCRKPDCYPDCPACGVEKSYTDKGETHEAEG